MYTPKFPSLSSASFGPSVAVFRPSGDAFVTETQTRDGKFLNVDINFKDTYCLPTQVLCSDQCTLFSVLAMISIPPGMVRDQFGMIGLLTFIRGAEADPNLVALALGR